MTLRIFGQNHEPHRAKYHQQESHLRKESLLQNRPPIQLNEYIINPKRTWCFMVKKLLSLISIAGLLLLTASFVADQAQARTAAPASSAAATMADEVVTLVNNLRQERGLAQLNIHPTLMQLAQTQAEYMAASGQITHLSADGLRPFQRALAAGFPVAGDLDLGGYYSENIIGGTGLTPKQAVESWLGDEAHQNTMFSEHRSDMGAGVAMAGDVAYYVLDTALASPYRVVITLSASPVPGQSFYAVVPKATATPGADGSIVHTVSQGETLWGIAAVYDVTIEQVAQLNRINADRFIYPGEKLVLRQAVTPTPDAGPSGAAVYLSDLPEPPSPTPGATTQVQPSGLFADPALNRWLGWGALFAAGVLGIALLVGWKK
jgi:uncharacterized protein YkwD